MTEAGMHKGDELAGKVALVTGAAVRDRRHGACDCRAGRLVPDGPDHTHQRRPVELGGLI